MNTFDGIPMQGTLQITTRDAATGAVLRTFTIKNKITFLAANVLVELIAQRATDPAPAQDMIYSMRMGTSSTAAQRSDTNLGAFVIGKVIGDSGKVNGAPGNITFIATLASGDANGNTLTEAGLFTAGSSPSTSDVPGTNPGQTRLFAHQIYPGIPKTVAIVIDYSWTIAFTAMP